MSLVNRNLVTIDDLSNGEVRSLFSLADEMSATIPEQHGLCRGKIMASLFFEPSTRTRLSFEAAMHRLGGSVITASDVGASSLAKGESVADTARIIGSYADRRRKPSMGHNPGRYFSGDRGKDGPEVSTRHT